MQRLVRICEGDLACFLMRLSKIFFGFKQAFLIHLIFPQKESLVNGSTYISCTKTISQVEDKLVMLSNQFQKTIERIRANMTAIQ